MKSHKESHPSLFHYEMTSAGLVNGLTLIQGELGRKWSQSDLIEFGVKGAINRIIDKSKLFETMANLSREEIKDRFAEDRSWALTVFMLAALVDSPVLKLERSLTNKLVNTSISGNIPTRLLITPFPLCYIDFDGYEFPFGIFDKESDRTLRLEGAYVSMSKGEDDQGLLNIMMIATDKADRSDIIRNMDFVLKDGQSIEESFESIIVIDDEESDCREEVGNYVDGVGREAHKEAIDFEKSLHYESYCMVVKALLYMATQQYRSELVKERTRAIEQALLKQNKNKREKAIKHANRLQDYVRISSLANESHEDDHGVGGFSGLKSVHWRRGFLRAQRFGKGLTESKLIWIEPVLVGASGQHNEAQPKAYVVT